MKKASTRTSFLSRLQQQAIRTMRHTGGSTRLEQSYILGWREQPSPFASAQSCVLRGPKGDATASTTTLIGTAATCAVPRTFAPILYMHTYAWPWLTVAFPCTTICIGRVVKTRLRGTLCAKRNNLFIFFISNILCCLPFTRPGCPCSATSVRTRNVACCLLDY